MFKNFTQSFKIPKSWLFRHPGHFCHVPIVKYMSLVLLSYKESSSHLCSACIFKLNFSLNWVQKLYPLLDKTSFPRSYNLTDNIKWKHIHTLDPELSRETEWRGINYRFYVSNIDVHISEGQHWNTSILFVFFISIHHFSVPLVDATTSPTFSAPTWGTQSCSCFCTYLIPMGVCLLEYGFVEVLMQSKSSLWMCMYV